MAKSSRANNPVLTNCANCEHSTCDEVWCEYKCLLHKKRIPEPFKPVRCKDFGNRNKKK